MLVLTAGKQKFEQVTFSPDGKWLAAAGEDGAYLWPLDRPTEPRVIGRGVAAGVGFVTGRDCLVVSTGLGGSVVHSISADSDQPIDIPYPVRHVTPSPTKPLILLSQSTFGRVACVGVSARGVGRVKWAKETRRLMSESSPVFTPAGDKFARVSVNRFWFFTVYQTATGKENQCVELEEGALTPPAADPGGDRFVQYGSGKLIVSEISGDPQAYQRVVAGGGRKHFTHVAFHPSGRYLAATNNDATVKLYDATSWQLATTFTWEIGRMRSVAFSPDGLLAAAGSDTGRIVIWDVDV